MVRYTEEQKTQALALIQEKGVMKAKEETGISMQTLYKWRNGGEDAKAEKSAKKAAPKRARKVSADTLGELLNDDGGAMEKIAQLESENLKLRAQNEKLRKALQSFLD